MFLSTAQFHPSVFRSITLFCAWLVFSGNISQNIIHSIKLYRRFCSLYSLFIFTFRTKLCFAPRKPFGFTILAFAFVLNAFEVPPFAEIMTASSLHSFFTLIWICAAGIF